LNLFGNIIMIRLASGKRDFLPPPQMRCDEAVWEQGSTYDMPYMPYWFESFAPWFPWIVPLIAFAGLWIAKSSVDQRLRRMGERTFYAALLVVAGATLRTVLANEGCWFLHMASMSVMILGAIFPHGDVHNTEYDGDMVLTDFSS
jgi:hypothetical protein